MSVCRESCDPPCSFGCELRQKNIVGNIKSRMNSIPPRTADPAWERGIVTTPRPDGSRMPILRPGTTSPLRVKEYGENRRTIDAGLRQLHT